MTGQPIQRPKPEIPPLVTMGDPRLAQPSAPVPPEAIAAPEFHARLETLLQAMIHYVGIGIAAPQVGWFERFFLMVEGHETEDGENEQVLHAWIDPEIVSVSEEYNWAWEGCLSVPGLRGWIRRPAAIAVRGYNPDGERVSREYSGWGARVFQHEYDHLDGLLFPYRAEDPRHIVMTEQLDRRDAWPDDWPTPAARDAALGILVPDGVLRARLREDLSGK